MFVLFQLFYFLFFSLTPTSLLPTTFFSCVYFKMNEIQKYDKIHSKIILSLMYICWTLTENWENRNIMYLCSWTTIVGNICGFYTVILSLCMYLCFFFFPLPLILLSFNHFLKILFVVVKAFLWFWVKKKCRLLCCLKKIKIWSVMHWYFRELYNFRAHFEIFFTSCKLYDGKDCNLYFLHNLST